MASLSVASPGAAEILSCHLASVNLTLPNALLFQPKLSDGGTAEDLLCQFSVIDSTILRCLCSFKTSSLAQPWGVAQIFVTLFKYYIPSVNVFGFLCSNQHVHIKKVVSSPNLVTYL